MVILNLETWFTNVQSPGITNGFLVMQTWALYKCGKLVNIIDSSLTDDLDIEEACRFLKIGLLCTQDAMTLRPSMSTVIKLLTGEKGVDSEKIVKPGIIENFMDLKIRNKDPMNRSKVMSSFLHSSPSSSENTTDASMTFRSNIRGRDWKPVNIELKERTFKVHNHVEINVIPFFPWKKIYLILYFCIS